MKTTTFNDILFAAAEVAMRTRDQVPAQEQTSLQFFLAAKFLETWNLRSWPELMPEILNVQVALQQFSKNIGEANEIGDILGIYEENPQTAAGGCFWNRRARPVPFYEGDDTVWVDTTRTSLWVEYQLPYPSAAWPDLTQMTLVNFLAAPCPLRFRNTLMFRGAGMLFGADGNPAGQSMNWKLAEESLTAEILRLPPEPPWRRTIRLAVPRTGGRRC